MPPRVTPDSGVNPMSLPRSPVPTNTFDAPGLPDMEGGCSLSSEARVVDGEATADGAAFDGTAAGGTDGGEPAPCANRADTAPTASAHSIPRIAMRLQRPTARLLPRERFERVTVASIHSSGDAPFTVRDTTAATLRRHIARPSAGSPWH